MTRLVLVADARSMAMQHRPEYQLSSQSPVLTARFHPFDTHVIIGGTYSGQVRKRLKWHPNRRVNSTPSSRHCNDKVTQAVAKAQYLRRS